jgi:hypothetical protein
LTAEFEPVIEFFFPEFYIQVVQYLDSAGISAQGGAPLYGATHLRQG